MARLILGLGNPGEEYRDTRHNVGFRVIEELARRWQLALDRLECNALAARIGAGEGGAQAEGDGDVLLAKPQTYMNRSGHAAHCFVERYELDPADVLVVYDEVNLPLGKLRLRRAGSPAGHRGLESILESLRTAEVPRLRLGVAPPGETRPPGEELADFVLSPFDAGEREEAEAMVRRAADAVEVWLREGPEVAMTRFNG
ncbi:MAG TPA: aminoacyl-tRNA hydrolase [Thermoanaerobaculia bacterium]|jgi:PTH1 family peptidyl-tRNA hydrolase|nr:aminoacyl-tRNA hydrolase [Thermoanaerobaculia bacterium]